MKTSKVLRSNVFFSKNLTINNVVFIACLHHLAFVLVRAVSPLNYTKKKNRRKCTVCWCGMFSPKKFSALSGEKVVNDDDDDDDDDDSSVKRYWFNGAKN